MSDYAARLRSRMADSDQIDTDSPYAAIGTVSGAVGHGDAEQERDQGKNWRQYFAALAG